MTEDDTTRGAPSDPSRRRFLTAAGVAGATAAAGSLVPGDDAEALTPPDEQVKSRYALNDHVARFYFLNSL